jgi:D-3-phosphoglycerate dehydrogenase / 2-oxoglutarate reductase
MVQQTWKVVITDCDHGRIDEEKEAFGRMGAELTFVNVKDEAVLTPICKDADGILNQYARMDRRMIEQLSRCKVIVRYGIGVDTIDLKAATESGIIVANVPDYCLDEVADHTVTLLLACARKMLLFDRIVRRGSWDFREGGILHRLQGKVLGLVGCGKIGLAVSRRMTAFGVRVIAFDPYLKNAGEDVELTDLDTVLRTSNFISIHCPLNESTRHLIGEREFKKMGKRPIIVNTSRGPIIDEKSLLGALETGQVSGAGLDVVETEPPDPENPLFKMENVILSPHTAFYSEEAVSQLKRDAAESIIAVLTGRWPKSVVNRDVVGKTRASIPAH